MYTILSWQIIPTQISRKGGTAIMKKYSTPEMKALAFAAQEAIAEDPILTSQNTNEVHMGWGDQGGPVNG